MNSQLLTKAKSNYELKYFFIKALFIVFVFCSFCSATNKVDTLLNDLASSDYRKAWSAASALGKHKERKDTIVKVLIQALNREWEHCSGDIREAIAGSFDQLGATEAVFPMLELLEQRKNTEHECAECGCCFLASSPADVLVGRNPDPFCSNLFLASIYNMADFSHSKKMADLVDEGIYVYSFLIILGKVGLPRYANFIAKFANIDDLGIRQGVAIGLGEIRNPEVSIPILTGYLGSKKVKFSLKWIALESLIKIGKRDDYKEVTSRLTTIMNSKEPLSSVLAARGLAFLGALDGKQKLKELTLHENGRVRFEAFLYIGECTYKQARNEVIKGLKDELPEVRACAVYCLGKIGKKADLPLLEKAFEDARIYADEYTKQGKKNTYSWDFNYGEYFLRDAYHDAKKEINESTAE